MLEPEKEITVTADNTMTISSVTARVGDTVAEGDVIAAVDVDSVEEQIDSLNNRLNEVDEAIANTSREGSSSLTSPVSGRVRRIFIDEGDLLSEVTARDGGVMEIAAAGQLKVDFTPQTDISAGLGVTVHFENDDEAYEAEGYIYEINGSVATAVFDDSADYDIDLPAEVYDMADHLLGSGVTDCFHPYLVEGSYGKADTIEVSEGDMVDRGSTLLTRTEVAYNATYLALMSDREEIMEDLKKMRRLKENPALTAKTGGIISSMLLQDAMPVTKSSPMYTVMLTDRYQLKAQVDELDIDGVHEGQTATIVFDAFDDREYTGTVSKVSSLGQNVNGVTTYTVTIDLEGMPEFKSAMSGTATIVTREAADVLIVPVDAIQTKDEKKVVTALSGDDLTNSEDREVTLGLVNNTMAEITDGLSEGETVLVIGSTQLEDMIDMMRSSRQRSSGGEDRNDPAD